MSAKKTSRSRREKQLHQRYLKRIHAVFRRHTWHDRADDGHGWSVRIGRLLGNRKLCRQLDVHHQVVGTVDLDNRVIWVDFTSDLLATFIHECLHVVLEYKYDRIDDRDRVLEEKEVHRLEKLIMRNLTPRQARNLLMLMLRHVA